MPKRQLLLACFVTAGFVLCATFGHAADKPIKAFILAGQSNMVGWGDSTKIPDDLRKGNDQNENCFIEVDELGGLHQIRMNDPKSMRGRLLSEDLRKPPKDKRPRDPADGH